MAEGNCEYEKRFGHVYLVCATGRSAEELLARLRSRLDNDTQTERRVLRDELAQINRIRVPPFLIDLQYGSPDVDKAHTPAPTISTSAWPSLCSTTSATPGWLGGCDKRALHRTEMPRATSPSNAGPREV